MTQTIFITGCSTGLHRAFNSVYHATKWGLEGWSESLSFKLGKLGIRVKTVAPDGIKTTSRDWSRRTPTWCCSAVTTYFCSPTTRRRGRARRASARA